jgi:molecular chaperone DnaJ
MKNYYDILGVDKSATHGDIKKAYRTLAKKFHPDHNKGDQTAEDRFKEINEAYETLSDEKKKNQYDSLREAQARGFSGFDGVFGDLFSGGGAGRGGSPGGRHGSHQFDNLGSFRDLFGNLFDPGAASGLGGFGAGGPQTPRSAGQDRRFSIEVPFEVAMKGGKSALRVPREESCRACGGNGAAPGSNPQPCDTCHGQGRIQIQEGSFAVTRPCPACFGRGVKITLPCSTCAGAGRVETARTLEVKIPKGVKSGAKVRLRGEGDPGRGNAPPGDLYLEMKVLPHTGFKRKGMNIHSELVMDFSTAVLGGKVDVQTFWGKGALTIPPGTPSGRQLRLKGQGVATEEGRRGDHLVTVRIRVPSVLTEEQKTLMEKLKETGL